ncbi:MAG: STAS-like domain-containing protein [Gemmatimonadetes bacterium]|nr:STAS-like domain-containing protein [Gemmatimonadota bacterium]
MHEIKVLTYGPTLASRETAGILRHRIDRALRERKDVLLDFTGVRTLSPPFAGECFYRLARLWPEADLRGRVRLKGASPMVRATIRFSLQSSTRDVLFGGSLD